MNKIEAYLNLIENHILKPIEETDLSKSCTATIILIFTAIDGLGKLLHPNKNAHSGDRFKFFLKELGTNYSRRENELWKLRNSLMHNGISNISFMSSTFMGESEHLKRSNPVGYIFVSSSKLVKDFKKAFNKLKSEILQDKNKINEIEDRLIWIEDDTDSYWSPFSTSPGPITFIGEKNTISD